MLPAHCACSWCILFQLTNSHTHSRTQTALLQLNSGGGEGGAIAHGVLQCIFFRCDSISLLLQLPPSHTHTSKETKALTTACSKLSTLTSQPPWEMCVHTDGSALTAYSQSARQAHLPRPTLSHSHTHTHESEIRCCFFLSMFALCFLPSATGLRILGSFSQCNTTMHHASDDCPRAAIAITTTTRRRLRGCGYMVNAARCFTLYTATTCRSSSSSGTRIEHRVLGLCLVMLWGHTVLFLRLFAFLFSLDANSCSLRCVIIISVSVAASLSRALAACTKVTKCTECQQALRAEQRVDFTLQSLYNRRSVSVHTHCAFMPPSCCPPPTAARTRSVCVCRSVSVYERRDEARQLCECVCVCASRYLRSCFSLPQKAYR